MRAKNPFRDEPAWRTKNVMDFYTSFRCQDSHIKCAFAIANDDHAFSVEHIQRSNITLCDNFPFELLFVEELRDVLSIRILPGRQDDVFKRLFVSPRLIFVAEKPAIRLFFHLKNFMPETDIQFEMIDSCRKIFHDLFASRVQVRFEWPVK